MNIYTNAYRVSAKNDGSEVILTLIQESPDFDGGVIENTDQYNVISSVVGSYVMTPDMARRIGESILSVVPSTEAAPEEE